MSTQFPLLVADIGGTHVRFGYAHAADAELVAIRAYRCADFASPDVAVQRYLSEVGLRNVARVVIAIASVVKAGPIKLTNSAWVLDAATLKHQLGAASVEVFNDFEAIAMVLPYLSAADYSLIGAATPCLTHTMAVIGPGTGLGVGGIVPVRGHPGRWQAICGEGGHVSLPTVTPWQQEVAAAARLTAVASTGHPHLSAEQLISGLGLPALYRAVAAVQGAAAQTLTSAEIGERGVAGSDPVAARTLDTFCGFLGTIAANLALSLGAQGGVFIAGGIVPQWGEFFLRSSFREHFENNGRYRDYLSAISTAVITAPYPGLMGLMQHAAHSEQSN